MRTRSVLAHTLCVAWQQTQPMGKAILDEGAFGRSYRDNRDQRSSTLARMTKHLQILAFVILALFLGVAPLYAQPSPPSRPILFVHGWCGSAWDWAPLLGYLFPSPPASSPIPGAMYTNQTVYLVEYSSVADAMGFWIEKEPAQGATGGFTPVLASAIPPSARLFAINFYDPDPSSTDPTDPTNVTRISILNKAYEIKKVIERITAITGVPSVNILSFSMGGLDARAYVESMASAGACYDHDNSIPMYSDTCQPGTPGAAFANDVANIITVDTPHAGSPLATPDGLTELWSYLDKGLQCEAFESTNMEELLPESVPGASAGLVEVLNYEGGVINHVAPTNNVVPIQAIQDYFNAPTQSWLPNPLSPPGSVLPGESDDIVGKGSQSITANLPAKLSSALLQDFPIGYDSSNSIVTNDSDCSVALGPMLHNMKCLGALPFTQSEIEQQLVNDSSPWISSWSVTPTALFLGDSVTVQFSALDLSNYSLSLAELLRAPDSNGQPGAWSSIQSMPLSGNGPTQVTFTDRVTAEGTYWYGATLYDVGGNVAQQPAAIQVTVNPVSATTYTLTVNSSNADGAVGITVSPTDNNGTGTGTTSFTLTYNPNAQVILTAPSTVVDTTFSSWSGCDLVLGDMCAVTLAGNRTVTANYSIAGSVDFGTVAIGSTSAPIPVTLTFASGGTVGSPVALTRGAAGLDFAVASVGTCHAGTYLAGNACIVNVTFTPKFAGLRN